MHSRILLVALFSAAALSAQSPAADTARPSAPTPWYARLSMRGYAQIRYNRLFESNKDLNCAQCDRSIGNSGGVFIRRGRLIISGDVSPRVSIYIQPDYASDAAGTNHYLQLRDAYFDLWLDSKKEHRIRLGQSKVPYGFENLQSSSNRLPLDRADATNSAVPNERDLGVMYYWASSTARRRFRILTDSGLKGSGDYGVFGIGAYNGQTANRPEANNSSHVVARLSYPFRLPSGQFVEAGVAAYHGKFALLSKTASVSAAPEYLDERVATSFTWYAQPLGVVAEWNWGHGPAYNAAARRVENRSLEGGFIQSMFRYKSGHQVITPYARLQYYSGGKKAEQDAKLHNVHEVEGGIEWLPQSSFELTAAFTQSTRTVLDGTLTSENRQKGHFLRLQAQINY